MSASCNASGLNWFWRMSPLPLLLQALGCFYFIHDSIEEAEVWDFKGLYANWAAAVIMSSHWPAPVRVYCLSLSVCSQHLCDCQWPWKHCRRTQNRPDPQEGEVPPWFLSRGVSLCEHESVCLCVPTSTAVSLAVWMRATCTRNSIAISTHVDMMWTFQRRPAVDYHSSPLYYRYDGQEKGSCSVGGSCLGGESALMPRTASHQWFTEATSLSASF